MEKGSNFALAIGKTTVAHMIPKRCGSSAWLEYMPVTHGVAGSSPVRTAINIENQCFTKQTPDFTPKNVKSGVYFLYNHP